MGTKFRKAAVLMKSLKLGVIGCGAISDGKYLPSLKAVGGNEVVAFCDIIPEKAAVSAKAFGAEGAKVFTDYRELLKMELDAVYVCTPNRSHSDISVAAMQAGKHVMCEKPMAINYKEGLRMLSAAQDSGRLLNIGYQNRYRQDSQYLKKSILAGALGEIYFARANAVRRRAVPTWGVFLNVKEQGGGPLIDIGTHALDLTLWMMDNYRPKYAAGTTYHKLNRDRDTANAWGDWDPDKFTTEDSAFGFIVMENGATIMLSASWALNTLDVEEATTTLSGTKGGADFHEGLRINGVRHGLQFTEKPDLKGGTEGYSDPIPKPAVMEQRVFLAAVRGEGELCVLPEQALQVTRILDAIYQSASSGKPVFFD